MDKEKLHDTLIVNETKFPEIFSLSEDEVLKVMEAAMGYVALESYQDWVKMYNGVHHESTTEAAIKHWLACVRWMKNQLNQNYTTMKYGKPKTGHVYFIGHYTAPKVFNGLYFECLLTDQKIPAHERLIEDLGHIKDYKSEIWKPERFKTKMIQ